MLLERITFHARWHLLDRAYQQRQAGGRSSQLLSRAPSMQMVSGTDSRLAIGGTEWSHRRIRLLKQSNERSSPPPPPPPPHDHPHPHHPHLTFCWRITSRFSPQKPCSEAPTMTGERRDFLHLPLSLCCPPYLFDLFTQTIFHLVDSTT
jgi:hypothetical protein